MKSLRRARKGVDLREIASVGVEHVDGAKLVEFKAGELAQPIVEIPGGDVDVFRSNQRTYAGAAVVLLDLSFTSASPWFLTSGGLFDEDPGSGTQEVEQGSSLPRPGRRTPARKDSGFAGARRGVSESSTLFATFEFGSSET